MNKKNKMRIRILVRSAIQVFFFFAAPALFISAFSGLRYIFTQFGVSEPLELNSFVKTLIFVLIYTFVFGRFICGYACPFGAVQDWCYMLASFIKKSPEICNEGCRACRYNCPVNLDLEAEPARLGECISCGDCADICPKDNINYGLGKKGGKIVYAIIKAGVLYAGFLVMTYILV